MQDRFYRGVRLGLWIYLGAVKLQSSERKRMLK